MALQGRDNANWWTTSYSLSYRVDGGSYESYQNDQVWNYLKIFDNEIETKL